jgi:hypothetical protein
MTENLFFKYFLKFIGIKFNYEGISVIHEKTDDKLNMFWYIDNPNDLSYNEEVLKGVIENRFSRWIEMSGSLGREYNSKNYYAKVSNLTNSKKFYLNSTDQSELNKITDKIYKLKYKDFYSDIRIKNLKFTTDVDIIEIETGIILLNPSLIVKSGNKIWLKKLSGDELVEKIDELNNDEHFFQEELQDLFPDVSTFVKSKPLLFDDDYMFYHFISSGYYDSFLNVI